MASKNELIKPEDKSLSDPASIENKIVELGNAVITRANQDRKTANDIYEFIRNEIRKLEDDYNGARHVYDSAFEAIQGEPNDQIRGVMLCKLGKPPVKKSIIGLIEQMNRSLENSIKSSDNVVNLLNTIAKANSGPSKVNIEKVEFNRSLLLDRIIREEQEEKEKLLNKSIGVQAL